MKEIPPHWHCKICGKAVSNEGNEINALLGNPFYEVCRYHEKSIVEAWLKKAKAP